MGNNDQKCLEAILSNDYLDFILPYKGSPEIIAQSYNAACYQVINDKFIILYVKADNIEFCKYSAGSLELSILNDVGIFGSTGIKNIDYISEDVYINKIASPTLTGKDVIIGIVESGIDFTLPIFLNENSTTKILSIWDQTIQGSPPAGFYYGTEFTQNQINTAIQSNTPYEVVPHRDITGYGTFYAGIIAGSKDTSKGFIGTAPDSELIIVKLKQAKQVMREFQMIFNPAIPTYQDSDIMLGIKYLLEKASEFNKPIVIFIGMSNNDGTHDGKTIFEQYIADIADTPGVVIVVAGGDEADKHHHYQNNLTEKDSFQDVDLNIGKNEEGFQLIMVGSAPDIFSIAILSPSGDSISRISTRYFVEDQIDFLLEDTRICISHYLYPGRLADQFFVLKFYKPTYGLWNIRVFGDVIISGRYDLWLPREGLILPETRFLYAQPNTTITIPSTTVKCITVGAYNAITGGLYIASGRGYTRDNQIKPDLVAPGVNIYGPYPNNIYGTMTGTGVSAAIVAGASALLLEWGMIRGKTEEMNTLVVKSYLIKGAKRRSTFVYPNNKWGYGELDVLNIFDILKA